MERGTVRLNKIVFWIHTTGKQQLRLLWPELQVATCTTKCCRLVLPMSKWRFWVLNRRTDVFICTFKKKLKCREIMSIGVHKQHKSESRRKSPFSIATSSARQSRSSKNPKYDILRRYGQLCFSQTSHATFLKWGEKKTRIVQLQVPKAVFHLCYS